MPSQQVVLKLTGPCDERWDVMTVVDADRRHCASCDRVLTDFSEMSDDELMLFFKQANGKICGRVAKHQLDRPLTTISGTSESRGWRKIAALIPLALFAGKASAQTNTVINIAPPVNDPALIDTIARAKTETSPRIQGTVKDDSNAEPVPFATVILSEMTDSGDVIIANAATDVDGNYMINLPANYSGKKYLIEVRYVGYLPKRVQFNDGITQAITQCDIMLPSTVQMTVGILIVDVVPPSAVAPKVPFMRKVRATFAFGRQD